MKMLGAIHCSWLLNVLVLLLGSLVVVVVVVVVELISREGKGGGGFGALYGIGFGGRPSELYW